MGKDKKTPITVEDKEYFVEDMSEQAKLLFNHVADLEKKMGTMRFNLDQLTVGRDAFLNMLKAELEKE